MGSTRGGMRRSFAAADDIGALAHQGLHEESGCGFYLAHSERLAGFTGYHKLLPENNTLCCAALRTISRLLDNGISRVRTQRLCLNGSG
jgi:hypothetical protein